MDFNDLIHIFREARSLTPVNFTRSPSSQLNTPAPSRLATPSSSLLNLSFPEEDRNSTPLDYSNAAPVPPTYAPLEVNPTYNIQISLPSDQTTRSLFQRLVELKDASTQYEEIDFMPSSTTDNITDVINLVATNTSIRPTFRSTLDRPVQHRKHVSVTAKTGRPKKTTKRLV